MSASVGGLMSQRNIATRMVSPGPAESKRVLARPSTVGSAGTVGGEVKQTSIPASAAAAGLPGRAAAVSPEAPAGRDGRAQGGQPQQAGREQSGSSVGSARSPTLGELVDWTHELHAGPEPVDVPIRDESIRLGQFLKLANLVESGAEAKPVIADGAVLVNGEVETRRGRQLAAGDVVTLGGQAARVATGEVEIDVPW